MLEARRGVTLTRVPWPLRFCDVVASRGARLSRRIAGKRVAVADRVRWILVASVVASACGPQEELTPLAEFDHLSPYIRASPDLLFIELLDHRDVTAPCAVVPDDFTARIGDLELPIESRGAWTGEFDGANECDLPTIRLDDPPPIEDAILELHDSSTTVRCDLGDELVPRSVAPIAGGTWELTAGQEVTVVWSHPHDLDQSDIEVWFRQGDTVTPGRPTQPIAGTDQLTFLVPASLAPGAYDVRFGFLAHTRFEAGMCGETNQTEREYQIIGHPVTIGA